MRNSAVIDFIHSIHSWSHSQSTKLWRRHSGRSHIPVQKTIIAFDIFLKLIYIHFSIYCFNRIISLDCGIHLKSTSYDNSTYNYLFYLSDRHILVCMYVYTFFAETLHTHTIPRIGIRKQKVSSFCKQHRATYYILVCIYRYMSRVMQLILHQFI